jgi:hypothetical protein
MYTPTLWDLWKKSASSTCPAILQPGNISAIRSSQIMEVESRLQPNTTQNCLHWTVFCQDSLSLCIWAAVSFLSSVTSVFLRIFLSSTILAAEVHCILIEKFLGTDLAVPRKRKQYLLTKLHISWSRLKMFKNVEMLDCAILQETPTVGGLTKSACSVCHSSTIKRALIDISPDTDA